MQQRDYILRMIEQIGQVLIRLRQMITGGDVSAVVREVTLPPDWQREYRPLLAEWFVRRHRDRLALQGEIR